ncbi:MAG: hypothetical protein AAGF11_15945 [Myxococcota bacterium]
MSTKGAAEDTDLLMVHADDLDPVLETSVAASEAEAEAEDPPLEDPEHLWDESREANDLDAQGWGVVAPEGPAGDELLGRIQRLIAHRRAQQNGREVLKYRVPPKQTAAEAMRWRKRVFAGPQSRHLELPRYLLILGDLDQVSAELQVVMGAQGYVGRLAFDRLEDYEAYVDKLLRWEKQPAPIDQARIIFHTVRDRTKATTVGHRALMEPGVALARTYKDQGEFPASTLIEVEHGYTPKPGPLIEEAVKTEPGVLFTISHGAGAPRRGWRSVAEQRVMQGGMSFGRSGGLLTGEALAGRPFMPGGVWFMLACFGAGTPAASKYAEWLRGLGEAGHFQGSPDAVLSSLATDGRPFTAAVPKAVLASPDGPLAFIGHVDLAWTYSFRELDDEEPVNRPNRFLDVFYGLLRHDRVGVAFRELLRHYGETNTELTTLIESRVDDPQRRGHLWMLRNDLAGYVLLGDPAAQLPIEPAPQTLGSMIDDPFAAVGFTPSVSPRQDLRAQQPVVDEPEQNIDPEVLERAIGLHLVGELGPAKIIDTCKLALTTREFERKVKRYKEAGRRALGLPPD